MDGLNYTQIFSELDVAGQTYGKRRVQLLKALEDITAEIFLQHPSFQELRTVLGSSGQNKVERAVLKQDWTGIPEYGSDFYAVLEVAVRRQNLQRAFVRLALDLLDHGFDDLDKNLIYHSSLIGDLYEEWYRVFCQTVQGTATATQLEKDDKAGKLPQELYNHYTVILQDPETGKFSQVANASHYRKEFTDIVAAFDRWIAELSRVDTQKAEIREKHLVYLSAYRAALAETEVEKLESRWVEVDQRWLEIKYWIQIVHDIETGYADPLRCKVQPEFSVRLMDESYDKENKIIQEIQGIMVDYFKKRPGKLAQEGIAGLKQSFAGIYYVPFQQAMWLFFRPAGQSIPNRSEVKMTHGVKIYFDPVATGARDIKCVEIAEQVCKNPDDSKMIDTMETIIYHIAAHEVGHAIYSIETVKDKVSNSTRTLLEEPRAELTASHTLRLLAQQGYISHELAQRVMAAWLLQDLRRFTMYDFSALRPYLISAMSQWERAGRLGYAKLDATGKVTFDHSKASAFLDECSQQFETILDAEDRGEGATIEGVLKTMTDCEESQIVKTLVNDLFHKPKAQAAAA